ncbi:hypothetical protein AAFC00_005471 [Neodothiora populina]|uniref:Uncharacterized protein n=1 Tax=Neodothiora populina TaxID=2781224 RepID=A0ABR3PLC9_9PEZI
MTRKRARPEPTGASHVVATESSRSACKRLKISLRTPSTFTSHDADPRVATPTIDPPERTSEQRPCPLLRLPWELRSQVYRLALQKPTSTISTHSSPLLDLTHDNTANAEPSLLRTCRRIRQESLPIFYACNDWVIKTRRVNNGIDPATRLPVLYEIIPRWVEAVEERKVGMMGRFVAVGSRGSFVDTEGRWREGRRAAFRVEVEGMRREGFVVREVDGYAGSEEDDDAAVLTRDREKKDMDGEMFCEIRLIDLLRAKMRWFSKGRDGAAGGGRNWKWSKEKVHEIAFLL